MFHSRRYGELQHASGMRSLNASRPSYLTNSLVGDTSRSLTYISKTNPADAARPVVRTPAPGAIVPGAIVHRSKLGPGDPLTVGDMLKSLGLGKYSILFQAEEVDMTALRQMRDNDLKELGIPMAQLLVWFFYPDRPLKGHVVWLVIYMTSFAFYLVLKL